LGGGLYPHKTKQVRHFSWYVTFRRVRATVGEVEKQLLLHIQVPCIQLVRLYHIFPHFLINVTIFRGKKKRWNLKFVFWFSLQLMFDTFLVGRRIERGITMNVYGYVCKVPVILVRF
jgi:hypothetical protein